MSLTFTTKHLFHVLLSILFCCTVICQSSDECLSKGCIKAAAMMLSNMDDKINPCEDFYQFACGKFEEKYSLFDKIDAIKLVAIKHEKEVKDLIKDLRFSEDEEMQSLKLFHDSCMNANLDFSAQLESVMSVLQSIADWPVLSSNFDEDSFDWVNYNEVLMNAGVLESGIVQLGINALDDSPPFSVRAFKISISNLSVDVSSFINATVQLSAAVINGNVFGNITKDLLMNVTTLVEELAMTNSCKNGQKDKTITIGEMYNVSDRIDWLDLINNQYSPSTATLNNSIRIDHCIYSILPDVISILDSTPSRTVATYMMLKTAISLLAELDFYYSPYKQILAQKSIRLKKCIQTELNYFPIQIFKLYSDKYLNDETKDEVSLILLYVHAHLYRAVSKADWLSSGLRKKVENVVKSVRGHLFLREDYVNVTRRFDEMVNLSSDDLLGNVLQLGRAKFKLRLEKMNKGIKDCLYQMALYRYNIRQLSAHLYVNYIGVSPSVFKDKFFSIDRPKALNYGSLGFIFGHELLHSINKNFIDPSSLVKKDKTSYNSFKQKSKICVDKLQKYFAIDLKIQHRGNVSLNEDIADIEGAGLAFRAFMKWDKKMEEKLPGLNFTSNQLFWLQLANTFCRFDNTYQFQGMGNDTHSHNKFRIWAIVSNSDDFARDFNCPIGYPMNPEEKCKIWL